MAWTDSLAYTEQGLLSVSLTDANATYSDEFQVWDRLGWVDAVDGGVSEGSGLNVPISDQNADYTDDTATFAALLVQLPTDANAAYDDSLEAFGAGFAQPAADPWETLADEITSQLVGQLSIPLDADDWATLDDQLASGGELLVVLDADDWSNLGDSLDAFFTFQWSGSDDLALELGDAIAPWQTMALALPEDANATYGDNAAWEFPGGSSPIEQTISDTWETLDDPLLSVQEGLRVTLDPDANADYTDGVASFGALLVSLPGDAWATLDDNLAAFGSLLAAPTADSNAGYSDSLAGFFQFFVSLQDDKAEPGDSAAYSTGGETPIEVQLADEWHQGYPVPVSLPADPNAPYTDNRTVFQGLLVQPLQAGNPDLLDRWLDFLSTGGFDEINLVLSADPNADYTDEAVVLEGLRVQLDDEWHFHAAAISQQLTDANAAYSDAVAGGTGAPPPNIEVPLPYDGLAGYADSRSVALGKRYVVNEPHTVAWSWDQGTGPAALGFRIYWGGNSGQYNPGDYYQIDDPDARSVEFREALPAGYWYVAVVAFNADRESDFSNELVLQVQKFEDAVAASLAVVTAITKSLSDSKAAPQDTLGALLALRVSLTEPDALSLADYVTGGAAEEQPEPLLYLVLDGNAEYTDQVDASSDLLAAPSEDPNEAYVDALLTEALLAVGPLEDPNEAYGDSLEPVEGMLFDVPSDGNAEYSDTLDFLPFALVLGIPAEDLATYGDHADGFETYALALLESVEPGFGDQVFAYTLVEPQPGRRPLGMYHRRLRVLRVRQGQG